MKHLRQFLAVIAALLALGSGSRADGPPVARTGPYILGADVSWLPEDEADHAKYYDHGVRKDLFQILRDYKFNYIRLRLFVDPQAPGGYAAGRDQAYCDLAHTEAMARRVKAAHMGLLLDLHYSDTWASPGHQAKPAAWTDLPFPQLTETVRAYTRHVVAALKAQGTPPDMVQVGNEISDGLLFPDGRLSDPDRCAALLKAGIAGVKDADPSALIMLHHHLGRDDDKVRAWLDPLLARGVKFDVIGLSCYAQAHEGDWKTTFDDLAARHPDLRIVAAEYSGRKRYLNDLLYNTPSGLGSFIWEPVHYREAIFDKDGRNAGGGANPPINLPAPAALLAPPPVSPPPAPRRYGGRIDTNSFLDLYPEMSRSYGNDAPTAKTR